jgi:hypothetical protein
LGPSLSGVTAHEKKTVQAMLEIYCADHHTPGDGLCPECRALLAYAHERLDRCPYGDDKPTCKECLVHCYSSEPREAIRIAMRYAGPRMFRRHPWLALVHLWKERTRKIPARPHARRGRR